jgi:hypothetical protein
MATRILDTPRKRPANPRLALWQKSRRVRPEYISKQEAGALLDRQARKYLEMSGAEFRERYESGNLAGLDPDAVRRVSFILPMSDG